MAKGAKTVVGRRVGGDDGGERWMAGEEGVDERREAELAWKTDHSRRF